MAESTKAQSPLNAIGGAIGAVGGFALSRYSGPALWIPGVAAIILLIFFAKTPIRPKHFIGAIAVTTAHIVWFIVGSAIAGMWSVTAVDIAVLSVGVLWLWFRPSLPAALFLGFVQLVSLGINAYTLSSLEFGSGGHKALTVHCVFRALALICLIYGYLQMRRASPPPIAATSPTALADHH